MTCVLMVDLEGAITDNAHRLHHMKSGDWETYEALAPEDPCHPHIKEFLSSVYWATFELVVVTGRYEKYYERTRSQLAEAKIYPSEILMRDNFDIPKTKEPELKLGFLAKVRELYPDPGTVIIALEDRDDVVEALRNAGIECWQVRNGAQG
jgi:beta-phosphoglucomutase-like phosphatase (HAD superfamily)